MLRSVCTRSGRLIAHPHLRTRHISFIAPSATAATSRIRSACPLDPSLIAKPFSTSNPLSMAQSSDSGNKRPRDSNEKDEHENNEDWKKQPPFAPEDPNQAKTAKFKGNCHCHDVTFEIYIDKPKGSHFCHCDVCQKLHGSAAHWSVVIPKNEVLFTCAPEKLSFYRTEDQKTEHIPPCKISCARCHSPIADEGRNMMLMYPSTWNFEKKEDRAPFLPDKHIFYAQRAIDVEDGQPKWEKMPDESKQMDEEHAHGEIGTAGSGSKKTK